MESQPTVGGRFHLRGHLVSGLPTPQEPNCSSTRRPCFSPPRRPRQTTGQNWPSPAPPSSTRELLDPVARTELIESVVEFEIDHGGTAIIPPYLHLTDFAGCAAKVQRLIFKETAAHLADLELDFPLFPVVSVDQRAVSLDPAAWPDSMGRLLRTANKHATGPIGLGLSMTTGPNRTNLHSETGLLAAAMGAEGY
jgi:hypothetical protein